MRRTIQPTEIEKSVFDLIGKDWMLVTATKNDGATNTMTASWGGLGVLWNSPVAFIFIRPQRYTKEFVDQADKLTLSFFDESHRKDLSYLGKVSGRDHDKIAQSDLHLEEIDGAPCFAEAKLTLICAKLYCQQLDENCFVDKSIAKKNYMSGDFHFVYVARIDKVILDD
ncbi:MAG: flavin reductase [Clostridia bacterium]